MRGVRLIVALAFGALGVGAATAVGASGSSAPVRATAAATQSFGEFAKVDPVLNDGTNAVLKALDQGLALVLGKKSKGGSGGFKTQQMTWNKVQNSYDTGETKFTQAANQASDQFTTAVWSMTSTQALERSRSGGVYSNETIANQLINLLKLISGYQKKMSAAAAKWDQVQNTASWNLQTAAVASASGTGPSGKVNGLKGATQLIQTVAKAEVTLYENVAIAEIEYEGGILTAQQATQEIDKALAAFEKAIEGGAKKVVKGSPMSWNQVVNKMVTPVSQTWNQVANSNTFNVLTAVPVAAPPTTTITTTATTTTATTTTATTTVTQPQTATTVTITCPTPPSNFGYLEGTDTITVSGSVSPPVAGGTVTINYDSSSTDVANTTATETTAANGTFTNTEPAGGTSYQTAQSIQATYAGVNSNSCVAELEGPG